MSYQLNKTDGTLLTELIDGQIDNSSTNLVLVGRNYSGYGEAFNENFIKLLENFANTSAPTNPLVGQLWYDKSDERLKIYDGTTWKASGGPYVQNTRPQMVAGDLWIDNLKNQLYAFDGNDLILVGPQYTESQDVSGFKIESILDTQSRSRTLANLYVGGELVAVLSGLTFTPVYSQRILGLVTDDNPSGIINEGINVINATNFRFYGTASGANALITGAGVIRTADQFLPSDANGVTVGTLTIQNSGGLTVGLSQNHVQKVVGPRFYFENQLLDNDISLRVRTTPSGAVIVDALYIDASTERVGIFTNTPQYTLDVNGDLRVTGDLVVEGDRVALDVQTLRVEDKIIEIGVLNDSTELTNAQADASGISVNSSAGSKDILWKNVTNAFTSNVNFDLLNTTSSYKIGGVDKLTNTTIDPSIITATGITKVGQLQNLEVQGTITINNTVQSATTLNVIANGADIDGRGILITGAGDIHVTDNQKITGLANPTQNQDAATKIYTDTQIAIEPIVFSMDITGLGIGATLYSNLITYLNDLYPAALGNAGKPAKIHATSYSGATVSGINVSVADTNTEVLQKSFIEVDLAGGGTGAVVQDIVANATASGSATLTPSRQLITFSSDGAAWNFVSDTTYP